MIKKGEQIMQTRKQIADAIKYLPEWFTSRDVSDASGVALAIVQHHLHRMGRDKELETRGLVYSSKFGRMKQWKLAKEIRTTRKPIAGDDYLDVLREAGTSNNIFLSILKFGHDEDFEPRQPFMPTNHLPGSGEKVEVMRRRVERGEALWHKDDVVGGVQLGKIPLKMVMGMWSTL